MECKWIIEEGTIWQIGNEQTAKIWQHKWVSNVRDNCIHGDILNEVDPNALQKSLQSTQEANGTIKSSKNFSNIRQLLAFHPFLCLMCFHNVIFEIDNLQIHNVWNQNANEAQRNYFQSLIYEYCNSKKHLFSFCNLSFTKRSSSQPCFLFQREFYFWLEDYPHQISAPILSTDIINICLMCSNIFLVGGLTMHASFFKENFIMQFLS